ncbi:DNA polymerase III subunit delta [Enemella sp. A6]|uniref:DNA polymerase III subunit delta n=1 Tax=Enemella sp. A6 TaxID=3440152 RepID=UPI003EBFB587
MEATPFGTVTLITGGEDLLVDRAVARLVRACREADPQVEVHDVAAGEVTGGSLTEMTGGSLFATSSVTVIRDLGDAADDVAEQILAMAAQPHPDAALVLVPSAGNKGRGVLTKLKKAKVKEIACPKPKHYEVPKFVQQEVRSAGGRIDSEAAVALVDAAGTDLRTLASAVSQLVADADGNVISEHFVHRYFAGRAEVTSFAIADAAINGRPQQALGQLRWALATGVAPVLVTSACASGLRGLAKLAGARRGGRDADVAAEVGVPPWKLKTMRQQLRGWQPDTLAKALLITASADADIKGAANDPEYALERMVLQISGLVRR